MFRNNDEMRERPRAEKYKGYDSFREMPLWDEEAGITIAVFVLIMILGAYVFWDEIVVVLTYLFWGLLILAFVAGVTWFLFSYGILINPFSVESRADRMERRKEKHISRVTRGRDDDELTDSELRRKDRIEASYNARIARLMDKL